MKFIKKFNESIDDVLDNLEKTIRDILIHVIPRGYSLFFRKDKFHYNTNVYVLKIYNGVISNNTQKIKIDEDAIDDIKRVIDFIESNSELKFHSITGVLDTVKLGSKCPYYTSIDNFSNHPMVKNNCYFLKIYFSK
jgi:hypothetical protein